MAERMETVVPRTLYSSHELLLKSLKAVLVDEGFKVQSPLASKARETAHLLVIYFEDHFTCPNNSASISEKIVQDLCSCFVSRRSYKLEKEVMWGSYHVLRTAQDFTQTWIDFIEKAVRQTPSPILYQHLTHEVFKDLIKLKYEVTNSKTNMGTCTQLTKVEENALRYVVGYICRKLKRKIELSSNPNKDDMVICLMDMSGDELEEDLGSENWTNLIDRGGLWHISDQAYSFFYAIEEEVRKHLQTDKASTMKEGSRQNILDHITTNDEVQFQWSMLSSNSSDAATKELFSAIIELYMTIRGFSFASACVELYKQAAHKTLQKGKGIRKELFTSNITK